MEKEIKEEELFIPKTKHKALKIILAIMLIGVLAAGGYFLYKEKFCNPNRTVTSILDTEKNNISKSFNIVANNKYKINGLIKVDTDLSSKLKGIDQIIKNINLQFNGEIDLKNNLANITLNTKYKNEQIIDIKTYYKDKTLYVLPEGVYDKYLELSPTKLEQSCNKFLGLSLKNTDIENISIYVEDIKILINSILEASKSVVNKLEFTRTNTTITINGKDQNVYNNYITLNKNEIKNLLKDMINLLSKDNEFINAYKRLFNKDASFDIDNLKISDTYKLNLYTTSNMFNPKFVGVKIETAENDNAPTFSFNKINDEFIISINYNNLAISSNIKINNSIFNIDLDTKLSDKHIKLILNSNYEKINEITKSDIDDSKKIEDLTLEEQQEISRKMQENKGIADLTQDISNLYPAP